MPKSTSLCAWKQCSKSSHAECNYWPLYNLGTLSSIVHELFLFADDRVSQQRKNVKHKWHVSIRTKQKVRLGFLWQPGSSPFMHFPSYAFCLQVANSLQSLAQVRSCCIHKNAHKEKKNPKNKEQVTVTCCFIKWFTFFWMVKIFHWEIVFPKVLWLFELQEAVSIRKKTQKLKFGNLIDDFISSLSKTNQNKMSILIWVLKLLIHNKDEDFKSLWDCAEENKKIRALHCLCTLTFMKTTLLFQSSPTVG